MNTPAQPHDDCQRLKDYGYAPGNYLRRCHKCATVAHDVDKRAITCRSCAEAMHAEANVQPKGTAEPFGYLRQSSTTANPPHGWAFHFVGRPGDVAIYTQAPARLAIKVWCETCNGSGKVFQEHQAGCWVGGEKNCPDCDGWGFSLRAGELA